MHSWTQYSGVGDRDQQSWGLHLQSLDTWIHVFKDLVFPFEWVSIPIVSQPATINLPYSLINVHSFFKITFPEGTANPARPLAQTVFWCSNDLANNPAPGEEERKFVLKYTFQELSDLCYIPSFPTSFAILGESTLLLYVLDPWSKHHSWHRSLSLSCLGQALWQWSSNQPEVLPRPLSMQELGEEHRIGWEGWGEEQQVLAMAGDIIKGRTRTCNRREGLEVLAKAWDIIKGRIAKRSWRWSFIFGRITLCLAGGAETAEVVSTKM